MDAYEIYFNGQPIAVIVAKNKAIYDYIINSSMVDTKDQCIIMPN